MRSPLPAGADTAGNFAVAGQIYPIERRRFLGPAARHEPIKLALFGGIHGDEPAGPAALRAFLEALEREPARATGYELWTYPVINPTGCERGTRENHRGLDLNRQFWRESAEPEVRIIERELELGRFDGLVTLHADDSCEGHYGYSHGRAMEDALLRPALLAAERILPRDNRTTIDGFAARDGVIRDCFPGILAPPPGQQPPPFNLIFETPAAAPLADQVAAHVAALDAVLATYRGLIAYAQGL
jgi:hypothetical protein